jgi:uncharacterized protein YukE
VPSDCRSRDGRTRRVERANPTRVIPWRHSITHTRRQVAAPRCGQRRAGPQLPLTRAYPVAAAAKLARVSVLPDPAELNAIADRIAGHAAAARDRAARLDGSIAGVGWRGPAAAAFLVQAQFATGSLRGAASRLDDAADALRRHAARVGAMVGDLARVGIAGVNLADDLVHVRVGDAMHDVGDVVSGAGDVLGDALGALGF